MNGPMYKSAAGLRALCGRRHTTELSNMPCKKIRAVCFTHNNYNDGDIEKIKGLEYVAYGVIGKEKGESGTPHLQGYLKFKAQKSAKLVTDELHSLLGTRPHCEPAKGSPKQNYDYCSKDGDFVEWGQRPKMGRRMDLEAAYDDARSDKKMIEVADKHKSAYIRYHRGIEKVRELHNKAEAESWREVEVIVMTGPTGCGKTRAAMSGHEGPVYKIQGDQLQWWDGYEGEKTVVIDEYSNDVKITTLLSLCDGYMLRLPVKGGHTYARWTKLYITTNLQTEELHDQAKPEHRAALMRRIRLIKSFWSLGDNPWLKASGEARDLNGDQPVTRCAKRSRSVMEIDDDFIFEDAQEEDELGSRKRRRI